jgi:hypothetical protein
MIDPGPLVETRNAWHAVADWILAPLRYAADGRIGLRAVPRGFGHDLARVEGSQLVASSAGGETRAALTTLGDAAALAGVLPGRHSGTYVPETTWLPDTPLAIDEAAADTLASWFAFGTAVLEQLATEIEAPTAITLWPEHFDVALTCGPDDRRVNVGASPGDAEHPLPYLYVGPWSAVDRGESYWNEPFGASLRSDEASDLDQALAFVRRGLVLAGSRPE